MTLNRLALAYLRRKDWEYEFLAGHVVARLGNSLGQARQMANTRRGDYVPAGQLLAEMGVEI